MEVSFQETGDPRIADTEQALHLYRIAQEALHNASKHGGARKVTVVFNKSAAALHLTIADDGRGMAARLPGARGIGLDSMRYRAKALGGRLSIDSHPNDGTIISCEVPNPLPLPAYFTS